MALFNKIKNIFKKPESKPKKAGRPLKKEKTTKKEIIKKETPQKVESTKKPLLKKRPGEIYRVLKEPHISEKATQFFDEGKYTFRVFPWANKIEIKKAINDLYGVRVKCVRIINIKAKARTLRGMEGKKRGYKKAVVTLEAGEKIEILPH